MTSALVAAEKAHSELGASVASRWMACPGSNNLIRTLPRGVGSGESVHAAEGTAAHALAETCLTRGHEPSTYIGASFNGVEVTEEMAEYVAMYTAYCEGLMKLASAFKVEHRFNLSALGPPAAMYGTADFVAYFPATRTLEVVDLKFGKGVVVEVEGNKQLPYYGVGGFLSPDFRQFPIDRLVVTICQPRVSHPDGVIRSVEMSLDDIIGFTTELLHAARATLDPQAPLFAGSHCRWCPASGVCPAQYANAQSLAQVEFQDMPANVPPAPESLSDEVFVDMLGKLHILEDWVSAMRATAQQRLERGIDVPGFKLVAKRAMRKWTDPDEAAAWLEATPGAAQVQFFDRKLKSPAQIEKLIGKKNLPSGLVVAISSGNNVVPAHDPRPAITMGSEFATLPASTGSHRQEEDISNE